jgi:hypothetical protein
MAAAPAGRSVDGGEPARIAAAISNANLLILIMAFHMVRAASAARWCQGKDKFETPLRLNDIQRFESVSIAAAIEMPA